MIHLGIWILKWKNRCFPIWEHYHSDPLFSYEYEMASILVGLDLGWDELIKKKQKQWNVDVSM